MNGQQLKNSILQMAVQGKLVPQDPNDEPASVLIQRIREEKEKLIKEKKIKKEKNPSYIFRGSDNLHYEKIGDNEPVCIQKKLPPFEIPDSWEWVRLNNIFSVINGDRGKNYPAKSTLSNNGIPFISAVNLDGKSVVNDDNLLCLSEAQYDKLGSGKLIKDDVVVCIRGSLGKHGKFPFDKGAIASSLVILRSVYNEQILSEFIMMFLDSPLFFDEIKKFDNGTAQPNLAAKSLEQFFVPIPPLAEQKRIICQIENINSYIVEYDKKNTEIEFLQKLFPEQLKKSILQEAVQGKLVPQDPSDEPACALLERIREEKARLIKEGKIKKDKNESVIFRRDNSYYEKSNGVEYCIDEELPFEIPDSWCWTRFKNIFIDDKGGGTPDKSNSKYWGGTIPWMSVKDFSGAKNGIIIDTIDHITPEGVSGSSTNVIDIKAIILCTRMGLGKYAKLSQPTAINQDLRAIWLTPYMCEKYFLYFYKTLNIIGSGVTVKGIKREALLETLIPIPPIQEQNRIIRTIDSMIDLCNKMTTNQ